MEIPCLNDGKSLMTSPEPLWKILHSEEFRAFCTLISPVHTRPMIDPASWDEICMWKYLRPSLLYNVWLVKMPPHEEEG